MRLKLSVSQLEARTFCYSIPSALNLFFVPRSGAVAVSKPCWASACRPPNPTANRGKSAIMPRTIPESSAARWAVVVLRDLMQREPAALFGSASTPAVFPWLVKFLDAQDWLSVQVHPDDESASRLWPGEIGKTEAWFVLDAEPTAKVYAGLLPGVDEKRLRAGLNNGSVAECLHSFRPKPGDCLFLPAGSVHAVGGGVLMAEVQQTSDATFRLFDWDRCGCERSLSDLARRTSISVHQLESRPRPACSRRGLSPRIRGRAVAQTGAATARRLSLFHAGLHPSTRGVRLRRRQATGDRGRTRPRHFERAVRFLPAWPRRHGAFACWRCAARMLAGRRFARFAARVYPETNHVDSIDIRIRSPHT